MHICAVLAIEDKLFPALDLLISTFKRLEAENEGHRKERSHPSQDATPIKFSPGDQRLAFFLERTKGCWKSPCPS